MYHILKQIKPAYTLKFTHSLEGGLFDWVDDFSKETDIPITREEYERALTCLIKRGLDDKCARTFVREGRYHSLNLIDKSGVSINVQQGFPGAHDWKANAIHISSLTMEESRAFAANMGLPLKPFTQCEGFNEWIRAKTKEQYYGKR